MKIDQNYIDNLWFRGGWQLETINDKTYYVINNPIYCQLFWLQLWHDVLAEKFKNQRNIKRLQNGDLSSKVILDVRNGKILQMPSGWANINYTGSKSILENYPPFSINVTGANLLVTYIVIIFIVLMLLVVTPIKKFNEVL